MNSRVVGGVLRFAILVVCVTSWLAVLPGSTAGASCVGAVVVNGVVLVATSADARALPPPAGRLEAVAPACNDAGQRHPDGRTTVLRFAGVPAEVAVRSLSGDEVYVARGSLTAMATHPLHRRGRPLRRRCARTVALRGVVEMADSDFIALNSNGRRRVVGVDAATTFDNRPAYEPVRPGQRLRITIRRCGTRWIADRIGFVGPTVPPERYRASAKAARDRSFPWKTCLLVGAAALALAGVVAYEFGR